MAKISLNEKMKRLRPFVNFNHDLRKDLSKTLKPSEKAEITRYYNKLSGVISQKHVVYRPRNSTNIGKAKNVSGQTLPKFKAYVIPSPTGAGRVKWKGNEVTIEKEGGNVRTIYPNQRRLAVEPEKYLQELLDDDKLYIINSKNDWRVAGTKRQVIAAIQEAMWKYGWAENVYNDFWDDEVDVEGVEYGETDEDGNSKEHFDITIIECDFNKRAPFKEYVKSRQSEAAQLREEKRRAKVRERSRARRAGKRSYGRKGRGK